MASFLENQVFRHVKHTPDSSPFWSQDPTVLIRGSQLLDFYPKTSMSYDEKLNSIVRMCTYVAIILALFRCSYLVFYIPLLSLLGTYGMYSMREQSKEEQVKRKLHPESDMKDANESFSLFDDSIATGQYPNAPDALQHSYPSSHYNRPNVSGSPQRPPGEFSDLNDPTRDCTLSTKNNPFMNVLVPDMRYRVHRPAACTVLEVPDIKDDIRKNYDAKQFRNVGDVWDHNGGQRQFFTMPWTTIPNDPNGDFGQWLYDVPPTKKEQGLIRKPLRRPNGLL